MIIPNLDALAQDFWQGTGLHDTFPREIEQAVALKLPLSRVKLAQLNVPEIRHWLRQRDIVIRLADDARDLCGCLVAHRGRGIAFVCGDDQLEEQRLTIAHEVAHFLVDYLLPRRQVIHALGEGITDVLDGMRPPTLAERAAAILSHVRLGAHINVLPRPGIDEDADVAVVYAEDRADRLALELVAPQECIRAFLAELSTRQPVNSGDARAALARYFGLPAYAFDGTIQRMIPRRPPSLVAEIVEGPRRRR